MQKGINAWAFGDASVAEAMQAAKTAGFAGIELNYAAKGDICPEASARDMQTIVDQAADIGIEICSLCTGVFWKHNLISDDAVERDQAYQHLIKMIELAHGLGTEVILVVPGFTRSPKAGIPVIQDYVAGYHRALEALRQAAPIAAQHGVIMAVENVWNKFLNAPLELCDFIDAVDSPHVGAYFDVGNVMRTGYPQHWIRALGSRIARVHFKDYRVSVGTGAGFVELLQGDVDYPAVMTALDDIGYDGYAIAEMFPTTHAPEAVPLRASQAMDLIFKM